jgi:hypothetical protein
MNKRALIIGCISAMSLMVAVAAQTTAPAQGQKPATAAPATPAPATTAAGPAQPRPATAPAAELVTTAAQEKALLDRTCLACHSEKAKATMDSARKLALDTLDVNNVQKDADKWELIVRKLRAGMMPPPPLRRPEPAVFESMIAFLENELDRTATPFMPPPGLHRLNRTEYANMLRDVLSLEIDPAQYLPSDDSTSGFDNIAGALGLSSTLVEAYVSAAQKISRLASRRRWSSIARLKTPRRTTTSKGCRSARAAGCCASTSSRRMASIRLRSRRSSATTCRPPASARCHANGSRSSSTASASRS